MEFAMSLKSQVAQQTMRVTTTKLQQMIMVLAPMPNLVMIAQATAWSILMAMEHAINLKCLVVQIQTLQTLTETTQRKMVHANTLAVLSQTLATLIQRPIRMTAAVNSNLAWAARIRLPVTMTQRHPVMTVLALLLRRVMIVTAAA
jgi:actin-like ATPase involved in cell morphogenesis